MTTTPLLKLPQIAENQGSKNVTHNEALRQIEALLVRVLSRSNGGPPSTPGDGDAYIVDSATGDWSGFAVDDIAYYYGGAWSAVTPIEGFGPLWVNDEDLEIRYNGGWGVTGGDTLTGLSDTPSAYTGHARKMAVVKADESGVEFVGLGMPVQEKTADYAVALADHGQQIAVTDTTSARTITLPAAATAGAGFTICVYSGDSTNPVTVDADSTELIDDAETVDLATAGDVILLVCDGTTWRSIAKLVQSSSAGDVTGPASSTDNAISRFNGTTGKTIQTSGVLIDDDDNLYGHGQKIAFRTADFTIAETDGGKNHDCASGAAFTITIPDNATVPLPVGFSLGGVQADGNAITFSPAAGVTLQSKGGLTSTSGQWAGWTLYKRATDEWVLVGDLA